ncbi:MAG: EVE domain-containing protein [Acidiferrobacter sp.]
MAYWLFKSEPSSFSLEDLMARGGPEPWSGVRNYQARNFMRAMRVGDLGFFYHSSCATPAIVGEVEVVRAYYPDATALDPQDHHYDPRAQAHPELWSMVDVAFRSRYPKPVSLSCLKDCPPLSGMRLLARGNRLSILPVTEEEWCIIRGLAGVV